MARENQATKKIEAYLQEKLRDKGKTPEQASIDDYYQAVSTILIEHLGPKWEAFQRERNKQPVKYANYISMEWLLGSHTATFMRAVQLEMPIRKALAKLHQNPDTILQHEPDPGEGNGGLGRLAACFADSAANLGIPFMGYGLFFRNGYFQQYLDDQGRQKEKPDEWLKNGMPWIFNSGHQYKVKYFGKHEQSGDNRIHHWNDAIEVVGTSQDMMTPSNDGKTINTIRLWKVKNPSRGNTDIDKLIQRLDDQLYPNVRENDGERLRLMQEYFLTSLSLQDIIARHKQHFGSLDNLSETAAIQLNDTHPALAVPEMMRLLHDENGLSWERSKEITRECCFYTNHTLMPEALEKWPVQMFQQVLPRHYDIIKGLDNDLKAEIEQKLPHLSQEQREGLKAGAAILYHDPGEDNPDRSDVIRMGHLAAYFTGKTNGVSAMHSELIKRALFPEKVILHGDASFDNCTNGITPRRWLLEANPQLAALITRSLGSDGWITDLKQLDGGLEPFLRDAGFRQDFAAIKQNNKQKLIELIRDQYEAQNVERAAKGLEPRKAPDISPDALFDVQVKRVHEYKRQTLNILHTAALYNDIIEQGDNYKGPKTVKIFAGKAAPDYDTAKEDIALINQLADKINNDPRVGDKLKVVYIPDYNVAKAKTIIPAADISEQISTAGTEASGTSNMKFALNGAITMGTRDGANVEIGGQMRDRNIFFFGHTKDEIDSLGKIYDTQSFLEKDLHLQKAFQTIRELPAIAPDARPPGHLVDDLLLILGNESKGEAYRDKYKVIADFTSYRQKQDEARALFQNSKDEWLSQSIENTRAGAHFSSDDTISKYAQDIWNVTGKGKSKTPLTSASHSWEKFITPPLQPSLPGASL